MVSDLSWLTLTYTFDCRCCESRKTAVLRHFHAISIGTWGHVTIHVNRAVKLISRRGIVEAHTVHRSLAGGETVLSGACYAICEWSRTGSPKDEREERKEIINRHAASLRGTFRTSA